MVKFITYRGQPSFISSFSKRFNLSIKVFGRLSLGMEHVSSRLQQRRNMPTYYALYRK